MAFPNIWFTEPVMKFMEGFDYQKLSKKQVVIQFLNQFYIKCIWLYPDKRSSHDLK